MATKKKSGAERRRIARELQQKQERGLVSVGRSWLRQSAYTGSQYLSSNGPAEQLPIYGIAPPTFVKAVQAAVNMIEIGNFYLPTILWDGMTRDDRVTASLATRIMGLLGEPMKLEPANETKRATKVRDDVAKRISKIFPTPQLAQLIRYALGLSVGIAQIKTTRTVKSTTPTIETWNPRFLWWDWLIRRYRMTTENRGTIVIDPEDPEWLIYEPYGPQGWLHGALLRSLALPWIMRYWTRTWWIRRQEVHGQPIRLGIIPADRTPADERIFLSQIGNFAHEAVVRLPQGKDGNRFDMKLLEAGSSDWEGFDKLLQHCDRSIEISILGQYQSTEGQGGLGNQEKAGESTLMRLIRGDAQIGETLRDKVLAPLCLSDYGSADIAPDMTWDVDPPEDLEKKARAVQYLGKGLSDMSMVPSAIKLVDMRALLEDYQIPVLDEDEVPEEDPPVPGAQPPADGKNGDAPSTTNDGSDDANDTQGDA